MHVGNRAGADYFMVDESGYRIKIEEVKTEKDLGVCIRSDLKQSTQCIESARRARSVLGMVRRNFRRLD